MSGKLLLTHRLLRIYFLTYIVFLDETAHAEYGQCCIESVHLQLALDT
jgi:hypothetical protein